MPQKSRPATVLVVDDARGSREALRMILEPAHRVLLARSATEALEILDREWVDLVTLDLNLPGMKGEALLRALRRDVPELEIIVITGCATLESAIEGVRLGVSDYLLKPFDVVHVSAAVARALERRRARGGPVAPTVALGARPGLGIAFLELLAETIEAKDPYMRGHARRVSFYATALASRLGLAPDERDAVRTAAFLHDLGKVGVPTELLVRAGALDSAERRVMQQHPVIGARLLRPLETPAAIALAVQHHHEWWDGSGYPDGLVGRDIPLGARIVSLADAFDAMSCDRPYRRALPRLAVLTEIDHCAGRQFDPELAKEFIAVLETDVSEVEPEVVAQAVATIAAPGNA